MQFPRAAQVQRAEIKKLHGGMWLPEGRRETGEGKKEL